MTQVRVFTQVMWACPWCDVQYLDREPMPLFDRAHAHLRRQHAHPSLAITAKAMIPVMLQHTTYQTGTQVG